MRTVKNMRSWLPVLQLCAAFLFPVNLLVAQDTANLPGKKWKFIVEPYLLLPNMSGSTGIAPLPLAEVDAGSKAIFERLKFGAMLNAEASRNNWTIAADFLYMNLEQDFEPGTLVQGGKLQMKQLGWELAGLRKLNSWFELGAGFLLNSLEAGGEMNLLAPGGGITRTGNQSKTWVDPMLITRLSASGKGRLFGQFRGEIGGFGIGSDLAWQINARAGYRFSKLFYTTAGFRAIGLDYTSGEGNTAFVYDMVTFGPEIRFGFSF